MYNFENEKQSLSQLKEINRHRFLRTIKSIKGPIISLNGSKLINFASNDYLGLSQKWQNRFASMRAVWQFGSGTGSSRLLSGHTQIHRLLEEEIALFKGTQSSLVFSSGYMANLGAICSLVRKSDLIILDKFNHASIIDACMLSGARLKSYKHRDYRSLEKILHESAHYERKLVITESVFSMEGDIAPLPEILDLCQKHSALLMIDEAHATGVLGEKGRGALEYFGLDPNRVDIVMGTLSKALGSQGGFIAGKKDLIEYLINHARPFIFSTGLSPASCAAALKAICMIKQNSKAKNNLWGLTQYFLNGLNKIKISPYSKSFPIVAIRVGSDQNTNLVSKHLYDKGIYAPAIRPPTVPENEGRIRISLSALHKREHIDHLLNVLEKNKTLFIEDEARNRIQDT